LHRPGCTILFMLNRGRRTSAGGGRRNAGPCPCFATPDALCMPVFAIPPHAKHYQPCLVSVRHASCHAVPFVSGVSSKSAAKRFQPSACEALPTQLPIRYRSVIAPVRGGAKREGDSEAGARAACLRPDPRPYPDFEAPDPRNLRNHMKAYMHEFGPKNWRAKRANDLFKMLVTLRAPLGTPRGPPGGGLVTPGLVITGGPSYRPGEAGVVTERCRGLPKS
jgi:hypothetical protein